MKHRQTSGEYGARGRWRAKLAGIYASAFLAFTATQLSGYLAAAPESSAISQSAANDMAAKITMLTNPRGSGPLEPVTITESEANSYLRLRGQTFLPPALHDPEIHIQSDQIAGAADVNFDELGKVGDQKDEWTSKLVAYVFKGTQHVTATGTLETSDGQGKLTLTSFTVGSTSLPAGFVSFLLESYVEREYKIDLSKPFPLPPHVTHIELGSGRAILHRVALSRR
jgi:hypothetical protein